MNTNYYQKKLPQLTSNAQAMGDVPKAQPMGDVPKAAQPVKTAFPNVGGITQSFYTEHTNADNYETGRPAYQQSQAVTEAGNMLAQHQQNKPGEYQSQYGEQIQGLIDQALNRKKFTYDFSQDPLYQQYAQQYQRGGQQAMKDTMAQSAALTGGYGNSYAQQVGQQTYQQYMEQLNNVIPELRNAAYQMYRDEGEDMRNNLAMLQGQDDREYGRHRDDVTDWTNELNYLYGAFSDMSQQEYQRYMNDAQAWAADRDYWYRKAYDEQQQRNWEQEFAARYGGRGGRGGGGGRKKGAPQLKSETKRNAANEIADMLNNGEVEHGSNEYNNLLDQMNGMIEDRAPRHRRQNSFWQ